MIVRGCVAFGRVVAAADVAAGEADPEMQPLAALEQVVGPGGVAGEDEAVSSARDGVVEPFRARFCAEEEEEGRELQLLAALQRDRLELPVRSVERSDLAAVADSDAVAVQVVDEVV